MDYQRWIQGTSRLNGCRGRWRRDTRVSQWPLPRARAGARDDHSGGSSTGPRPRSPTTAKCPTCGVRCPVETKRRPPRISPMNAARMNYPAYRQAGLPITTAWMESLVKEMGYLRQGTEMFWNDPGGGEVILQDRAATLSDDDRLSRHILNRPGSPFTRRPKPPKPKRPSTAKHGKAEMHPNAYRKSFGHAEVSIAFMRPTTSAIDVTR